MGAIGRERARASLALAAVLVAASACGRKRLVPAESAPVVTATIDAALDEAAPVVVEAAAILGEEPPIIRPASRLDDHSSDRRIRVRRLVYRFVVHPSWSLGGGRPELLPPTGELTVDMAGGRLRARFVGTGFPVDDGAEVRMRSDLPGVYVFDASGGKPVGTGQMAAWFQAGPGARTVELTVRTSADDDPTTIDLVCRFFGEWAGTSIASVRRSCGADGLPIRFRFGPYQVDRTAEAWIDMAESGLRADHLDPPRGLVHQRTIRFHTPEELRFLTPSKEEPLEHRRRAGDPELVVTDGLVAENRTGARVLVTVDGVALGWLDPGERASFEGIPPGGHLVGGMLPLGGVTQRSYRFGLPAFYALQR